MDTVGTGVVSGVEVKEGIATQSVTFVEADDELVLLGQSLQLDAWVSSWYCPGKQAKQDVASCRLRASRISQKFHHLDA